MATGTGGKDGDEGDNMTQPFSYTAITIGHNAARTLDRTLTALESLRPAAEQIILVDDASTDETVTIANAHPAVTVVRLQSNQGAGGARNTGAKHASTPWLLLADADCYVEPSGFRKAIELLWAEPDLDGVMGVFAPDAPSGPMAGRYKNFYRHCEIAAMENPPHIFTSSCFLIRKTAYEIIGGFDEAFGATPTEDNEFYFRLLEAGRRVKYLTQFSFTHDKPMGLARLLREDAQRVEAIVRNLRGQLGTRRGTFGRGERLRYLAEMACGWGLLAGPVAFVAGLLIAPQVAGGLGLLWLAAAGGLCLVNFSVLRRAVSLHGLRFAAAVVWYRAAEMAAAGVGMARASFWPRHTVR